MVEFFELLVHSYWRNVSTLLIFLHHYLVYFFAGSLNTVSVTRELKQSHHIYS